MLQESVRSKVYVAMDFSGEDGGRVLDNPKDIRRCDKTGPTSKDGYVPFRWESFKLFFQRTSENIPGEKVSECGGIFFLGTGGGRKIW